MRAGQLDTRVALQRKATVYSGSGDPIDTWLTLVERWAAMRPLTGIEANASEQWVAREQTEFTVRWSQEIAALSPLDRVICPADDASVSPEVARSVYDIVAVHEIGRNEALRIIAARRVA
jgi:head-tail adaptor